MSEALDLKKPLSKEGSFKNTVKIASVEKKDDIWFVKLEGSAISFMIKPDKASKLAKPLEVGAEAEAEIQVNKKKTGEGFCAFIVSFGGASQGAYRGGGRGGSYQPKTAEEIHAASICGLGKSTVDLVVAGKIQPNEIASYFDTLADAYWRNLAKGTSGKANAVSAPQQAGPVELQVQAGGELPASEREALEAIQAEKEQAVAYWYNSGGTDDLLRDLKLACKTKGADWWVTINEGAILNLSPAYIVRFAQGDYRGKAEPGEFRNPVERSSSQASVPSEDSSTVSQPNSKQAFMELAEKKGWPTAYLDDPKFYQTLFRAAKSKEIKTEKDFHHLDDHHWWITLQWALRVEEGKAEPTFSMAAYAKQKEAASA